MKEKHIKSEQWKRAEKSFNMHFAEVKKFALMLRRFDALGLGCLGDFLIEDFRKEKFEEGFFEVAKELRDRLKRKADRRSEQRLMKMQEDLKEQLEELKEFERFEKFGIDRTEYAVAPLPAPSVSPLSWKIRGAAGRVP